jgi:hypothetical protein
MDIAPALWGIDGLDEELARLRAEVSGRSAPYARAVALLPEVLSGREGRFVAAAWEHRGFVAWYDRPLLLLAALRHDALVEGPGHPLHAAFAAEVPDPGAVTVEALRAALDGARDRVFDALAHRGVQTNETSRAVAWLWPAALAGASGGGRRLALADVGASAGLNLVADALPPIWTDERGDALEVAREVQVVTRLGLDAAPLDPLAADTALWLRACVWPGERAREERLDAAIAAFRAARIRPDGPVLLPVAAPNVPQRLDLLSEAEPDALVLAYQTVVRDYLEPDDRAEYETGMRAWLGTHPAGRALWVELEPAGGEELEGTLVAHARSPMGDVRTVELARCGLHPIELRRRPGAEAELRALVARDERTGAGRSA